MADVESRLEPLAARWGLPPESPRRLEQLLRALAEDPLAPTSVRDPLRGADVHVADSLSGLQVPQLRRRERLVDIGSGAGLPGLPLAIAMPRSRFDLVEASKRKSEFLERVVAALRLDNVRVVHARAEEWAAAEGVEAYDGAVVRAVGLLATLVEYGAPLLQRSGFLVAWKGRRDEDEERRGAEAAAALGMKLVAVEWVGPFAGSRNRHLHVYEKIASTPTGYPRRPGMARKRPLGGRSPAGPQSD